MKIKEAEKLTGLPSKTIKYYEEENLITPKRDTSNNYREYDEEDILQLKKIKLLRKLGFSIQGIKDILSDPNAISSIFNNHIKEIDNTIETQNRIKDFLQFMLKDYNDSKKFDILEYLSKISLMEEEGYKFMDENVREAKFQKDSKITTLMLIGYIIVTACSIGFFALGFINIVVFLVIIAAMLIVLVIRHSSTTGYICAKCGGRFNISGIKDFISPHNTHSKYLKCPHCGERSWNKESFRA